MAELPEELLSHTCSYLHISAELQASPDDRIKLATLASVSLFLEAVDHLHISTKLKHDLQAGLREGLGDAERALLLWLCTKLEIWRTYCPFEVDESLVFAVIREATSNQSLGGGPRPRPLQHLREVSINETESSRDLADLADVLMLPALVTFRGRMLRCDECTALPESLQSKVKRIYLNHSLLDGMGSAKVLIACPDLETLSVQWGGSIVGKCWVEYDKMGEALRQHGTKLKNLRLDPEEDLMPDDDPDVCPPLGSLKALTSLRLFSAPHAALFGGCEVTRLNSPEWLRETLPVSLRTLEFPDANDEEAPDLYERLLEVMRDKQFEELSTIRVNRSVPFTENAANDVGWSDSESSAVWGGSESKHDWVVLKRDGEQGKAI
ncbi:hypothetical protein LTR85_002833 [Meristemomyces frigidus]|nr:hypothetical protein LTR85_002833 [Meristemomyces frigidus]